MGYNFQTVYTSCSEQVKLRNSVQDNRAFTLDDSYIETAIYNLFRIDILNYIRTKTTLAKEFHIQPSEIDKMPVWEYEIFMSELNKMIKEENERNKKDMDAAGLENAKKMSDPKYMANQQRAMQRQSMSSIPKMPSMNIPKL